MKQYRSDATQFATRAAAVKAAKQAEREFPEADWFVRQYRDSEFCVLFENVSNNPMLPHGWL